MLALWGIIIQIVSAITQLISGPTGGTVTLPPVDITEGGHVFVATVTVQKTS